MVIEYTLSDRLYTLGLFETMCFQAAKNHNNCWFMVGDKLMYKTRDYLGKSDRIIYHYDM